MKSSAKTAAIIGAPMILPASVLGRNGAVAPSERITVGHIGCGKIGRSLRGAFGTAPDVQMLACSDVESARLKEFTDAYSQWTGGKKVEAYDDYRDLLARSDIDAVIISTPDHWHAKMTIEACRAGKDVYCEKPLTFSVQEAYDVMDAVQHYGRVLQTGSMQRSMREFRFAVEMVRNGRIGRVHTINTPIGGTPNYVYNLVEEPQNIFNWDRWVGPAPLQPYNSAIAPKSLDAPWAGWRRYAMYGGGGQSDWGAHMYDIAQWGLNRDGDAPVEVIPAVPNDPDRKSLTYVYDDGVKLHARAQTEFSGKGAGVEFIGDEGAISVWRGGIETKPGRLALEPITTDEERVYRSTNHSRDFLNCIKTRQKPICNEVVGASSAIVCHLGNIANRVGETLEWDHKKGLTNNAEANRLLNPPKRDGYTV